MLTPETLSKDEAFALQEAAWQVLFKVVPITVKPSEERDAFMQALREATKLLSTAMDVTNYYGE